MEIECNGAFICRYGVEAGDGSLLPFGTFNGQFFKNKRGQILMVDTYPYEGSDPLRFLFFTA
ncbi:hypothetical protein GCM10011351_25670 [Paraliobacillus quinghaiensis]|uniref:Uncharacterized protein n=1 Tax=Paraliobacillus quinghaiensis TaxID=470815 RepID=A0A917WXG1_9BACI|nr:hypothetical protein GCM10011351_25670 [Paraliobacillus quinghaiensis]